MSELEKSAGSVSESERSYPDSSSDESSSEWSSLISDSSSGDSQPYGLSSGSQSSGDSQPYGWSSGSSGSLSGGENPFGILTIEYEWPEDQPDLDTGTTFLGSTVGNGFFGGSSYMTWEGDVATMGGIERVIIDLAAAWEDGAISTIAEIETAADWNPGADRDPFNAPFPDPGVGPATLRVSYSLAPGDTIEVTINPGSLIPATTFQRPVTVLADGTFAID